MNPTNPFDSNFKLLEKVLDLRSKNQQVISSNIANAETPGYSARKFEFESELESALSPTNGMKIQVSHPSHISPSPMSINSINGKVTITPDKTGVGDENSVSINNEMVELSKNQIMYETTTQLLKKKLSVLKYAISDGK